MKKILLFQWFDCKNQSRKQELTECINHNIAIGFDEVIIFNDSVPPHFFGDKIKNVLSEHRITYRDYINIVNNPYYYGSLVVLTNTDIKLDKNIFKLSATLSPFDFICLSRYEANGEIAPEPQDTQDTWAIISQPMHQSVIHQSAIPLGMPGCETRFAEILFNIGYRVFNPSLDIKCLHVQKYPSVHKNENRIFGAILATWPCTIAQIKAGSVNAYPRPFYYPAFVKSPLNIG